MQQLSPHDNRLVKTMQLLGDDTRYKIFKLLYGGKNLCVSEIAEELHISVPAVSQHFRIFELVGIVDKVRTGQRVCYKLKENDEFVAKLTSFANN